MLAIILSLQTLMQCSLSEFKEVLGPCENFPAFTKNIPRDKKTNKHSIFFDFWEVSRIADFSAAGQFLCKSN